MKIVNKETLEQARMKPRKVPDIVPTKDNRINQAIAEGKRILEELKKRQKE